MEYDEIRITTRREITICEAEINRLEKDIAALERKYGKGSDEFFRDHNVDLLPADKDISRWHESRLALVRWQERLAAHQQIMKL